MKAKFISTILMMLTLQALQTVHAEEDETPPTPPAIPDREIYLFDLALKDGNYTLTNKTNISNNKGYDNQPYFMPDSESVLFVSQRGDKETDVFQYDIKTQKTTQLTDTPHAEYSPKPIGDSGHVSFVSEGFNPYQSVWQLDVKTGKQSWLLNSKEPVGYYHANASNGDVLFWSRYGWSVQYLNIKNNMNRFVSGNAVPSSPQQVPNSDHFSFVHRQTNGQLWIKAFDPEKFSITHIAPIFDDNFEYGWAPNGDILRVQNNKIFIWPAGNQGYSWQPGPDLSESFKGELGRLAVSPDGTKITVVESL
jgi:hypothetical protein